MNRLSSPPEPAPTRLASMLLLILVALASGPSSFGATGNPGREPAKTILQNTNRTLRLAIGGFALENDPPAKISRALQLADLVAVQLFAAQGFELVERLEIEKLAREASLSVSRWSDPASASRVGGILRADWLLLGTFMKYGGTNCLVVRVVDAQTGIVRDMTCLRDDETNLTATAQAVCQFAIDSPRNISRVDQRVFLGVGGFEDIGVNNRHPELRKNLRLKLEETFRGTAVAVVERTMVNPLLEEFRLYTLGLSASAPSRPAMPAFFLIDGTYQSRYEGGQKIELILKVDGVGNQTQVIPITAPAGNELLEKVAESVRDLVRQDGKSTPADRESEILTQLARGQERARLPWAWDNEMLGGYAPGQDDAKRRQNIAEAIEAFETVLLLDPNDGDAKLYLGRCLLDPMMSARERGRNYLEELLATTTNAQLALVARLKLAETYLMEDDARALKIYSGNLEQTLTPGQRVTVLLKIYIPMERLHFQGRYGLEEGLEHIKKFQRVLCDAASWAATNPPVDSASPPPGLTNLTGFLDHTFTWFVRYQNFDQRKGKELLDTVVPDLCDRYPRWAAHILTTYVLWCANLPDEQPTTQPIFERLTASIEALAQNQAQDPLLKHLQNNSLGPLTRWCNTNNHLVLLEFVLCIRAGRTPPPNLGWQFPPHYLKTNVPPPAELQWKTIPPPSGQAGPVRFSIGKPLLTLPARATFACDGGQVWVRNGDVAAIYEIATRTLTSLQWPQGVAHTISCIAVSKDYVWFGTQGSGLVEYDKRAQSWRRYTEEQGLILPKISALHVSGQTLWIGFGDQNIGGVACLNMATHQITAFTPSLNPKGTRQMVPHFTPSGSSEPPRNRVVAFAEPTPGELWVGVYQVGLQQYFAASNTWATIGLNWWNQCLTSFAITPNKMVLGGNCDDLHCAIIDRQTGRRKGIDIDNYVQPMKASPSWANQVVYSMAPDGDKLWLGGVNYLALVDLRTETVARLAEFGNPNEYLASVRGLQVVGEDLWMGVQNELYHLPRSTWSRNLTASK